MLGNSLSILLILAAQAEPEPVSIAPPMPLFARIAHADLIVRGRVTKLEDQEVQARPSPSAILRSYRVAELSVSEVLYGPKMDRVRVGYSFRVVDKSGKVIQAGDAIQPPVVLNQEALFFLRLHYPGAFYHIGAKPYFVSLRFLGHSADRYVEECRQTIKLLADPKQSLQSNDPRERLLAAGMLIYRYRSDPYGLRKTEEIDAEESKLILQTLAKAEQPRPVVRDGLDPFEIFLRLWRDTREPPGADGYEPMKAWLKKNADTYRIRRYVRELPK